LCFAYAEPWASSRKFHPAAFPTCGVHGREPQRLLNNPLMQAIAA
jgi:hypothetical protein